MLAAEGAEIIASGRGEDALRTLAESTSPGHGKKLRGIAGDLRDAGFVRRLAEASAGVDILVNNAGVLTYAPVLELTASECEDMFRVNVLAALQLAQSIGAAMAKRKRGHIVVMTLLAARDVYPFGSVYCATKHALTAIPPRDCASNCSATASRSTESGARHGRHQHARGHHYAPGRSCRGGQATTNKAADIGGGGAIRAFRAHRAAELLPGPDRITAAGRCLSASGAPNEAGGKT